MVKKKQKTGKVDIPSEGTADISHGCECELVDEMGEAISLAVQEGVARFLAANRGNIQTSSKEQIAMASYGGGMMDMVMLVRNALGRWAVEQLLIELESWNDEEDEEDAEPFLNIATKTAEKGEMGRERMNGPAEQIGDWVSERKGNGRKPSEDPMFA